MSDRLADVLREAAGVLTARGTGFALIGGLAVSVRTEPRFTRDADLAVAVADDAEAEAVVAAFAPAYEPATILEHETLGRLAAVRLTSSGGAEGGVVLDLLFASSGVEREVVDAAEVLEVFPGVHIGVARTGHLIALKLLSRADTRPLDDADITRLLEVADDEDRSLVGDLLALMSERGTDRGRDLVAAWEERLAAPDRSA